MCRNALTFNAFSTVAILILVQAVAAAGCFLLGNESLNGLLNILLSKLLHYNVLLSQLFMQ